MNVETLGDIKSLKKIVYGGITLPQELLSNYNQKGFEFVSLNKPGAKLGEHVSAEIFDEAMKDAHGYIPGGESASNENLDKAKSLEAIVFPGTGYSSYVDVDYCKRRGIKIGSCPGANAAAVSEFSAALILDMVKDITVFNNRLKGGVWELRGTPDVFDKKVGIIGMGHVGAGVARIMRLGFGCEILYSGRSAKPDIERELGARMLPIDGVLAQSDIIVIAVTLSDETKGMIDKARVQKMKSGCFLLNVARKDVLDQDAVIEAVKSGKIRKYASDVYHNDPITPELVASFKGTYLPDEQLIITPHSAFFSPSSFRRIAEAAADTVVKILSGVYTPNRAV
jgi:lactate dehydrogenase-like 2-hydroxyacid dehydrogenase